MPCDQVRTTTVDVEKMDGPLLIEALRLLGYQAGKQGTAIEFFTATSRNRHRYENGRLTFANMEAAEQATTINQIKQAYSGEVVKATAARFGWELKKNPLNKFSYTAIRKG
mgnify:CR=1 FL=1